MAEPRKGPFVGQKNDKAPFPAKVTVYRLATREPVTVWPIDARELVKSGEYVRELPAPASDEQKEAAEQQSEGAKGTTEPNSQGAGSEESKGSSSSSSSTPDQKSSSSSKKGRK